jgi:hypothetical protein
MWRPFHMIGLETSISVLSAVLRNEPTGCSKEFRGAHDLVAGDRALELHVVGEADRQGAERQALRGGDRVIGLETSISVLSAVLRNEPTGCSKEFRGDAVATANLVAGDRALELHVVGEADRQGAERQALRGGDRVRSRPASACCRRCCATSRPAARRSSAATRWRPPSATSSPGATSSRTSPTDR